VEPPINVISCVQAVIMLWHKQWNTEGWAGKQSELVRNLLARTLTSPARLSLMASQLTLQCLWDPSHKLLMSYTIQSNKSYWIVLFPWWFPNNFSQVEILENLSKICNLWTLRTADRKNNYQINIIYHWCIPNTIDIRLMCLKRVHCMTSPDIPYKGCFITSLTRQNIYFIELSIHLMKYCIQCNNNTIHINTIIKFDSLQCMTNKI